MLTNCPECELQVSDKANTCPHCGYPLKEPKNRKPSTKHKRLPNGFGQISYMKNSNLRNPYRAMVTVGKNSVGKPICKLLKPEAYFHTYNEAYAALVEYNRNPYDLEADMTVFELYEKWTAEYFVKIATKSQRTITSAWAYCSSTYDLRAKDIRARHIKYCMEEGTIVANGLERKPSVNIKSRIKSLFNLMLDYALEYEIVDKNYARTFNSEKNNTETTEHIAFTEEEMELLWKNKEMSIVNIILFQCYSGWRPQELGLIRLENVDLEQNIIVGGMKTDAGRDRIVPIHQKIKDIVIGFIEQAERLGSEYLINCEGSRTGYFLSYDKYCKRFKNIISALGLNPEHRAHDPRKHFVTQAKKYKVDEYAIKYIVGHSITDLTEKTYTERDVEWLKSEISKIL